MKGEYSWIDLNERTFLKDDKMDGLTAQLKIDWPTGRALLLLHELAHATGRFDDTHTITIGGKTLSGKEGNQAIDEEIKKRCF